MLRHIEHPGNPIARAFSPGIIQHLRWLGRHRKRRVLPGLEETPEDTQWIMSDTRGHPQGVATHLKELLPLWGLDKEAGTSSKHTAITQDIHSLGSSGVSSQPGSAPSLIRLPGQWQGCTIAGLKVPVIGFSGCPDFLCSTCLQTS